MKVQQERVANQGRPVVNGVKVYRPKRAAYRLDQWGPLERSWRWNVRCWKHYRKTQYKPI